MFLNNISIGLVNFYVNNSYGSIYRFCPSTDFMDRLKNNRLRSYSYYDKDYTKSETHEYNNEGYELLSYKDYFKENYNLNIVGYINQSNNFYLVSKFFNNGLTFLVLNSSYGMTEKDTLNEMHNYIAVINKNSPKAKVIFLLRYPNNTGYSKFSPHFLDEVKDDILKKYKNCLNILIQPFSYQVEYNYINQSFIEIRENIEKFFTDEGNFVTFTPNEQESVNTLLHDPVLAKKSIFTEKTVRAVCSRELFNTEEFMNKLVSCGLFHRFSGNKTNQYFFKNGSERHNIIPTLLMLMTNSSYDYYNKNKVRTKQSQYFLPSHKFIALIQSSLKQKIPMCDRLILKILENLKVGRPTFKGDRVYLRVYDFKEFGFRNKFRFIYN